MDRLSRTLAGGCFAVILGTIVSTSGCRSMRNDVPPGKPYSTTGGTPPIGFSSDPRANTGVGGGMYSNGMTPGAASASRNPAMAGPGGAPQYGTPGLNSNAYGAPTAGAYSGPGTNSGTNN